MQQIGEMFECEIECITCLGEGIVCEDHPDRPWGPAVRDGHGCLCGAAGRPCPRSVHRIDLVGWVQFDGDEYHSFQFATAFEQGMMKCGMVPNWRESWVPLYGQPND